MIRNDDHFQKLLDTFVWVTLPHEENFLKVKETLSRIGIASKKDKTLFQSCHILHKKGRYAIVHFKELFALDGKPTNFTEDDIGRRNTIVKLLVDWELIKLENKNQVLKPLANMSHIKVISYEDKPMWNLVSKYQVGKKLTKQI